MTDTETKIPVTWGACHGSHSPIQSSWNGISIIASCKEIPTATRERTGVEMKMIVRGRAGTRITGFFTSVQVTFETHRSQAPILGLLKLRENEEDR